MILSECFALLQPDQESTIGAAGCAKRPSSEQPTHPGASAIVEGTGFICTLRNSPPLQVKFELTLLGLAGVNEISQTGMRTPARREQGTGSRMFYLPQVPFAG